MVSFAELQVKLPWKLWKSHGSTSWVSLCIKPRALHCFTSI